MLELCARAPLIVVAFFVTVRTRHPFLHLPRKIYGILLLPFSQCTNVSRLAKQGEQRGRGRERQTSGHLSKSAASFAQPTPPSSLRPSASSCRHCHQISKGRDDDVSTLLATLTKPETRTGLTPCRRLKARVWELGGAQCEKIFIAVEWRLPFHCGNLGFNLNELLFRLIIVSLDVSDSHSTGE